MGLIEQEMTSSAVNHQSRNVRAAFGAVALTGLILVGVLGLVQFLDQPAGTAVAIEARSVGDTSIDYVEALRGRAFQQTAGFDASYDQIEKQRGVAGTAVGGIDDSYDQIEQRRSQR